MSGAVELEAELRAWLGAGFRQARFVERHEVATLLDTIATLRSDNERLVRERDEARARIEELDDAGRQIANMLGSVGDQLEAAEAERDTLLAQVEKMRGVLTEIAEQPESFFEKVGGGSSSYGLGYAFHIVKTKARAALTTEPS